MFSYFLAAFWIILGLIFLWRRTSLLNRIRKKGAKLIFRYILVICVFASGSILTIAWDIPGAISKIIGLALTVVIWVYAFRQNLKIKDHFAEFCEQKLNDSILKRIALMHIIIGVAIITTTFVSNNIEAQQKGTQWTQNMNDE